MKRVALFMTASLRSSPEGMFTPALVDLVTRLSAEYDLTVFTVIPPTGETEPYQCGKADVCVVSVRHNDSVLERSARSVNAFLKAHRNRRFDLVHGFWATPGGLAAVCAGLLGGVPSIVTLQGGEAASLRSIDYGNMTRFSTRALTLWVCRRATKVTALTRFQADAIASRGLKRDVEIIPYGAPEQFFCGASTRPAGLPLKLLHVADLNPVKDQETLLRAFRITSQKIDARLTVVGRDLLRGRIEGLAREMGIGDRVRFMGHVHHLQLPPLYFEADFLLHTSLYEAQGVVISEACSAGCVVCGTRVGLIADLEGKCTVAVPPRDPEALANALLALASDPARYREIQSAARAWAEEHPASWTSNQFSNLYEKASNF